MASDKFLITDNEDGSYFLSFDDFNAVPAVNEAFEDAGYESGGYGWHGVVEALVRMKAPHLRFQVNYGPESSMFAAIAAKRELLVQVAALMRDAMTDVELLQEALKNVDPELMD